MPWTRARLGSAALAAVIAAAALLVLLAPAAVHAGADAPVPPSTTVAGPAGADGSVLDNPFIPEQRDLSECVSALPKPDCGSDARGGWRQWLILGALGAGLAFIAWRVILAARRDRSREVDATVDERSEVPR